MTEHEEEYLRERRAEADAGAREGKAGHTAGPWEVGAVAEELTYLSVLDERGFPIAVAQGRPILEGWADLLGVGHWSEAPGTGFIVRPDSEVEANAYLIAAAPSILSACARAHAALDAATSTLAGMDLSPGSRLDELCGELAAAREACGVALGRAEGEE